MSRRVIGCAARVWLAWQLSAMFAGPLEVWTDPPLEAAAVVCRCAHAPGSNCPMHRPSGAARCTLRSTMPEATSALLSLFGPTGVLPTTRAFDQVRIDPPFEDAMPVAIDRPLCPDPPPPRA